MTTFSIHVRLHSYGGMGGLTMQHPLYLKFIHTGFNLHMHNII